MYFEITQPGSRRYTADHYPAGFYYGESHGLTSIASSQAERIWIETKDGVKYAKDRTAWDRAVDMKEFAWIKLKAKPLKDFR